MATSLTQHPLDAAGLVQHGKALLEKSKNGSPYHERPPESAWPTEFGEPAKRAYPMPDKTHAANAKARATQMLKKGKLSESEKKN
jgi:hypothetical protein